MSGNSKAGRIQTGFNHCLHHIFARIVVLLLGGLAVLLPAASARAAIALVDTETNATTFGTNTTALLLGTPFTVSASANTLVVVATFRNSTATTTEAPATLGWTNGIAAPQTLNLITQKGSKAAAGGRNSAIYYCYNPTPGTNYNISGKLSGQGAGSGTSSGALVAYTLSGVDTTVATPPSATNSFSNVNGISSVSCTIGSITGSSWAAVAGVVATQTGISLTGGSGTPVLTVYTTAGASGTFSSATSTSMGYISAITGGSDTFTYTFNTSVSGVDGSLSVAVFAPLLSPPTISITAANASPNPVLVGSPVLFSVTATSTAGSITSVVVNAGAIGGPSAFPLNFSAGNVYTNSVTATIPSANASLPVTVQDSAGNVLAGSIPVSVETPGAGIVLQDGSTAITEANGSTVSQSFTVTTGASVLVVLVEEKGLRPSTANRRPWRGAPKLFSRP